MIEGQSLLGEFLDVRHGSVLGSIVTEVVHGIVLGDQEHDVRSLGGVGCQNERKKGKGFEDEGTVHEDDCGGDKKGSKEIAEFISSQWHKDFGDRANRGVHSQLRAMP